MLNVKKLLVLSLSIALSVGGSSAQAASKTTGWKTAYKSYVLNYLDSEDFNDEKKIVLVDIDKDGVPELLAGSTYRTVNYVDFAYTYKNGKVQSIKQTGPGMGLNESERSEKTGFNLGMAAFTTGQIKFFKNVKNGKITVVGRDETSSAIGSTVGEYILQLQGNKLMSQELSIADESEESPNVYKFKGKKVSKSAYDKSRKDFFSQFKQISSQAKELDGFKIIMDRSNNSNKSNEQIVDQFLK